MKQRCKGNHGYLRRAGGLALAAAGMLVLSGPSAWAVPSFSRQTGLSCDTCHTVPPQLKPFGRFFKLHGYVMSTRILSPSGSKATPKESIDSFPPLSVMLQTSDSWVNKAPAGTQNNSVEFPQQLSLFYAGRLAPHLGAFMQVTYSAPDDHFSMDNTDIRYARSTSVDGLPVVWGIDVNNNPTVEDLWNSTPAWGFPYIGSDSAPGPAAAPIITAIGQQVAGLGGYAWIDNAFYVDLSVYRSAQVAQSVPLDSTAGCGNNGCVISGLSPYWRLGWEHDWSSGGITHSLELGTFGLVTHVYPTGVSGPTDNYTDLGVDSQYQMLFPHHSSLAVHALYIHENQKLNATFASGGSSHLNDTLNAWSLNAQYYWHERFGPTVGYFDTTGSSDALLYAANRTFSPGSSGWQLQWTYLPWQNVQLGAQYVIYTRFDGASHNYDGSGRNAGDNDTLYLFGWLLW